MPSFTATIELDSERVAQLTVIATFYGQTVDELLAEALWSGLDFKRAMWEHDTAPPSEPGVIDDDIPF